MQCQLNVAESRHVFELKRCKKSRRSRDASWASIEKRTPVGITISRNKAELSRLYFSPSQHTSSQAGEETNAQRSSEHWEFLILNKIHVMTETDK